MFLKRQVLVEVEAQVSLVCLGFEDKSTDC